MILCKKDDEEKGSSLQNEAKDAISVQKSNVQRKPFGCAITQPSFPQ